MCELTAIAVLAAFNDGTIDSLGGHWNGSLMRSSEGSVFTSAARARRSLFEDKDRCARVVR
jgi:hypothetical protein